jgi:tryptophan-rich hypothetical protein
MNKINPEKLLKSKWTAAQPKNREKHFMVTEVGLDGATSEKTTAKAANKGIVFLSIDVVPFG